MTTGSSSARPVRRRRRALLALGLCLLSAGVIAPSVQRAGAADNSAPTVNCVTAAAAADSSSGFCPVAGIKLVKSANLPFAEFGDVLTFSFTVSNAGGLPLDITITDPLPDLSALSCPFAMPFTLTPFTSATCTATYTVTLADVIAGAVDTIATATGNDEFARTVNDTSSFSVRIDENAMGEISASTDVGWVDQVGARIGYRFEAFNTGVVPISDVVISAERFLPSELDCVPAAPAVLDPDQKMVCTGTITVTAEMLDVGGIANTASVTYRTPRGATHTYSARADVEVMEEVLEDPAIFLIMTAVPAIVHQPGDVVAFSFNARNTGDVTLTNVTISDPGLAASGTALVCSPITTLAPGDGFSCLAHYVVTLSDMTAGISTTATASGVSPLNQKVKSTSTLGVVVQRVGIQLTKTTEQTIYDEVGDVITYRFGVTNTGDMSLVQVTLDDPLPGLSPITCSSVPVNFGPGATYTCKATYVVTQADLDAGAIHNTATVSASALSPGTYVTATAEADLQAVAAPVPVPDTEPVPDTTPMPDVGPATQPALPATGVTPWPTMGWTLTLLTVGLVLVVAASRRRAPF